MRIGKYHIDFWKISSKENFSINFTHKYWYLWNIDIITPIFKFTIEICRTDWNKCYKESCLNYTNKCKHCMDCNQCKECYQSSGYMKIAEHMQNAHYHIPKHGQICLCIITRPGCVPEPEDFRILRYDDNGKCWYIPLSEKETKFSLYRYNDYIVTMWMCIDKLMELLKIY